MSVNEFLECDTCRAEPGMPILCEGCLQNRAAIDRLTDALDYAEKEIGLSEKGFCQGVLFTEALTDISARRLGTPAQYPINYQGL